MHNGEDRCVRANRQSQCQHRSGTECRGTNQAVRRMIHITKDVLDPAGATHIMATIFDPHDAAKTVLGSQTRLIFRQARLSSLVDDCLEVQLQLLSYVSVAM